MDPSAAAYGSNENSRALVRAFVSDFDAWARDNNCAILILSHPPKWAADYSGSTDWEASVRSMWTLRKERIGPAPKEEGEKRAGQPARGLAARPPQSQLRASGSTGSAGLGRQRRGTKVEGDWGMVGRCVAADSNGN